MQVKNSNIIITGGSSGIGRATAEMLIHKGANVLITGRNEKKLMEVAKTIGATPLLFDISDLNSIPQKAKEAIEILGGKVDTIVNNAGIGTFPLLGEITAEKMLSCYNVNVFGLALLTQELAKHFQEKNYGNIINLGSTAALKGFARGSVYAASKFAVRGMTQSWQAELRKYNIRVTLINPSEVTTAFADEERIEREEEDNKLAPQEIAHAIVSAIEMRDKGFVPEVTIWATNPF